MVDENFLIKNIKDLLANDQTGIGDDCAVLPFSKSLKLLATTDMLVENVDFDFNYCSPGDVGYKSIMVNLSDIAAMGGAATSVLISLGMPKRTTRAEIKEFYRGVKAAITGRGIKVVGGDLSQSARWVASVTVLGKVPQKNIKYRSGAKPGHALFYLGNAGWSAAGLALLRSSRASRGKFLDLRNQHLRPKAMYEAGQVLGGTGGVGAMIDVSDGISTDLTRICSQSNCGATIYSKALKVSSSLLEAAHLLRKNPLDWILHGGEDYGLLFTCSRNTIRGMKKKLAANGSFPIEIGLVSHKSSGIKLQNPDSKLSRLEPGGFDHFK